MGSDSLDFIVEKDWEQKADETGRENSKKRDRMSKPYPGIPAGILDDDLEEYMSENKPLRATIIKGAPGRYELVDAITHEHIKWLTDKEVEEHKKNPFRKRS